MIDLYIEEHGYVSEPNDYTGIFKGKNLILILCESLSLSLIHILSENNRIGLNISLLFQDPQVYLHFLASMFVPNYQYIYGVNVFETNWHVTR